MMKIISLELNEVNFEFIEHFIRAGELPNFRGAIDRHGLVRTQAEQAHELLEPWIQWPTFYCGKTFDQHGIFRMGDVVSSDNLQIWERLEQYGLKVGAISPANAANRCASPAFFLPDPWTDTPAVADPGVLTLHGYIRDMVNRNASDTSGLFAKVRRLLPLAAAHIQPRSIPEYLRLLRIARKAKWARAAILDRLLADMSLSLIARTQPDYCSIFLNGAAHIQHHHMFDSDVYNGDRRNPDWYSSARADRIDPLLCVYRTYDQILGDMLRLKNHRVLVTTGLSQVPNHSEHYQYRLIDAKATLQRLGLRGFDVQMRMSRDFLLTFQTVGDAAEAQSVLAGIVCAGGPLFTVDNRGDSLFCQVTYHGPRAALQAAGRELAFEGLDRAFVLASIENGIHSTVGYHLDTGLSAGQPDGRAIIPLPSLFDKLVDLALAGKRDHPTVAAESTAFALATVN